MINDNDHVSPFQPDAMKFDNILSITYKSLYAPTYPVCHLSNTRLCINEAFNGHKSVPSVNEPIVEERPFALKHKNFDYKCKGT